MQSWLRVFATWTCSFLVATASLAPASALAGDRPAAGLGELGINRVLQWTPGLRAGTSTATYVGLPRADALLLLDRLPKAAELVRAQRERAEAAERLAGVRAATASAAILRGDLYRDALEASERRREAEQPSWIEKIAAHPVTWAVALAAALGTGVGLGLKFGGR